MAILLIDCYLDPKGGAANFLPYLPKDTIVWHVSQGDVCPRLLQLDEISGVVITGSAACVHDDEEWIVQLFNSLKQLVSHNIPCFGICFGHQALAKISGARVGQMSLPEVGWKLIKQTNKNLLWSGVDSEIQVFLSHRDAVLDAGELLSVFASSPECGVQAFQHKNKPIWGIQFHPEMPIRECEDLLEYRRRLHPELELDWEKERAALCENTALADQLFQNFLRYVSL